MTDNPLSGNVELDIQNFKAGINELSRGIRVAESGFKASAAAMEDWSKDATGLEMRIGTLNKQMDLQRQKVQKLQEQYNLMVQSGKYSASALDEQKIRINGAAAALNKMELESKQAASALEKLRNGANSAAAGADKVAKSAKGAHSVMSGLGGTLGEVASGLTGVNIGAVTVAGAFLGLANAAKKSVESYSEYVDEMRKTSSATGTQVEDVSRLVQAMDDMRISQDVATNAMEKAVDNGFVPSIDNIAKLAGELEKIQDPAERANLLSAKFGKSWKEIEPFLAQGEQAVRDATAAVSDQLAVTEKAVKANNDYKLALDNLGDAWTEVQNAFAQDQLPGLTGSLKIFADNITDLKNGVSIFQVMAENQSRYNLLEQEGSRQSQAYADRLQAQADAQARLTQAMTGTNDSALAGQYATRQYYDILENQAAAQAAAQLAELKDVTDQLADAQAGAAAAQQELATAQDRWKEGTGNDVQRALEQAGIKGDDFKNALGAIDEVYGTSLSTQQQYEEDLAGIVEQYKTGKIDVAGFKEQIGGLKDNYMKLDETIGNANAKLEHFMDMWGSLESKVISLTLNVPTGGTGAGSGSKQTDKNKDNTPGQSSTTATADGGDRYQGQRLLVGEEGPELIDMPADGHVFDAKQTRQMLAANITIILQGSGDSEVAQRRQATFVVEEIQRRLA